MGVPSPPIPTQPRPPLPSGLDSPAKSGNVSDSSSLPARAEASAPASASASASASLQTDPQTTSLNGSIQFKAQASTQAAIAGLASRTKNESKPDGGVAPADTANAVGTSVVKGMKVADVQALTPERVDIQTNPAAGPMSADSKSPSPVGDGKSGALPSASPESALPMLEALAERSAVLAQAPTLHAADGSALATTGVLSRAGETQVMAAPATPLAPAPATQPQAPVIQVEGGLRWMLKGGTQEAELQLHPDSLGQVTIHLRVEGGEVHARLWITEPASMQAVQEGRPHLEMALKEQGLQLGSFDLQQGHRPFQEAPTAPSFREPSFPEEAAPTRQEAPALPATGFLNSHHVELYA